MSTPSFTTSGKAATWRGVYVLLGIGLVLRLAFSFTQNSFYYYDEVHEYLEQAHRIVFGYGIVPFEYVYGIRSWIFPFFLSIPLFLAKWLSLDQPGYYLPMVQFLLCLISSSMIFSAYVIGRNLVSESAGRMAAFAVCFWYELIYFAPHALTEPVAASLLLGALACYSLPDRRQQPVLLGILIILTGALRLQYLPVTGVIGLLALARYQLRQPHLRFPLLLGLALTLLFVGFVDWMTWGGWFISYYNNFVFQFFYQISNIWGQASPYWFFGQLLYASTGLLLLAYVLGLVYWRQLWLLLLLPALLLAVHMLVAHKEYRFIFGIIPLLLVISGCVAAKLIEGRELRTQRIMLGGMALALLGLSAAGVQNRLPREREVYWRAPLYSHDYWLDALMFLSKRPYVRAVYMPSINWYETGGYFFFHHNVPLYSRDYGTQEMNENPRYYVSYIVDWANAPIRPGFRPLIMLGNVRIQETMTTPVQHLRLPNYTRIMPQAGVTGLYQPSVNFFMGKDADLLIAQ